MNGNGELRQRQQLGNLNNQNSELKPHDLKKSNVNPFVHSITPTTLDKIKCCVLTVLLLPVRVVCAAICVVTAYLLASLGLLGVPEEELHSVPLQGWRRMLVGPITAVGRACFILCGYRVTKRGKQASPEEAPLLIFAPHGSYLDALVAHWSGLPCLIIRSQDRNLPFLGQLIRYTQPVFVWREDPNSRQNTIKEIIRRATSKTHRWQQILIFPEGTCTNRRALITFKPGAFYPGVPVQPVCIRYPNRLDTISWTWEGPSALKLLWLTLTQFYTNCEIEFLPVYRPSEEEKQNPKLYAENVRNVMAKALEIPVTDYTYEDCRLMNKARLLGLPPSVGLVEIQKLRDQFGVTQELVERDLIGEFAQMAEPTTGHVSLKSFADYLKVPSDDPKIKELFQLYDTDKSGYISLRNFIVGRFTVAVPALEKLRNNHLNLKYLRTMGVEVSNGNPIEALEKKPEWAWVMEQQN